MQFETLSAIALQTSYPNKATKKQTGRYPELRDWLHRARPGEGVRINVNGGNRRSIKGTMAMMAVHAGITLGWRETNNEDELVCSVDAIGTPPQRQRRQSHE